MDANNVIHVASVLSQHADALKESGAVPLYLLFWSQFRELQIDTDKYNAEVERLALPDKARKALVIRKTRMFDAFRDATQRLARNNPSAEIKYVVNENTLAHEDAKGVAVRLLTRVERHVDTKLNLSTEVARFRFRADLMPPTIETEVLDALDTVAAAAVLDVNAFYVEEQGRADSDKFGRRIRNALATLQGVTVDPGQVMRACKATSENRQLLTVISEFVERIDTMFATGAGKYSACKVGFADMAAFTTVLKLVSDGAANDFGDRIGELQTVISALKADLQLGKLDEPKARERREEEIRKLRQELKSRAGVYREELTYADVKVGINEERIEEAWQDFVSARTNILANRQVPPQLAAAA